MTASYHHKARASMRGKPRATETDGAYLLKLVCYVLVATVWLRMPSLAGDLGGFFVSIPVGLMTGIILVRLLEKIETDRKIWYAVLFIVAIVGNFLPTGIVL